MRRSDGEGGREEEGSSRRRGSRESENRARRGGEGRSERGLGVAEKAEGRRKKIKTR
jgi:hypothetical protein